MNKIVISREQINSKYFECNSLLDVLTKIKSELTDQQQVVCGLRVNDDYISDESAVNLVDYKISDLRMIEVEYCSETAFYIEFLDSTIAFIKDLVNICPHMSEKIYANHYEDFHGVFTDFISSMDSLTTALVYAQNHLPESLERPWSSSESKLSAVLQQTLDAFMAKDYVVLADLIEYEMIEVLEDWQRIIARLKDFADEKPGNI